MYSDENASGGENLYHDDEPPEIPKKKIIVIDDTLDLELKKHGFAASDDHFRIKRHGERKVNVSIKHVRSKEGALEALEQCKTGYDFIRPENVAIVCDYKLEGKNGTQWGPDILTDIIKAEPDYKPGKLFLMSKSGFRGEDKHKLDAIGAEYFHTNEFFYLAAHNAGKEGLKQVFSQRAKTNNFRAWCNKNLGTDMELGVYRAPNTHEADKGRMPVTEVIRRVKGGISHGEAFELIDTDSVRAAFRPQVDATGVKEAQTAAINHGVEGPSVAGRLAFSADDIARIKSQSPGDKVILVLDHDYAPSDHPAIAKADAVILLAAGTQHIPMLAKNFNIPLVFANREKYPDFSHSGDSLLKHEGLLAPRNFAKAGDWLTLDGTSHHVYAGKLPIKPPGKEAIAAANELAQMGHYHANLTWHCEDRNDRKKLVDHTGVRVYANADNAEQVAKAKNNKRISGIGLLRTEHMFLSDERRELLMKALAGEGSVKQEALTNLTRLHTQDLEGALAHQTDDWPVRIRLFDFPPDEFFPIPTNRLEIEDMAAKTGLKAEKIKEVCEQIHSKNLRGAAFLEAFPEIANAQYDAIFTAAEKHHATPNITVPVIRSEAEFLHIQENIQSRHKPFHIGAMIETKELIPESVSDKKTEEKIKTIAWNADYLSIGSNDMTEELLGIKRGDTKAIIDWSQGRSREGINPFDELSEEVSQAISCIMYFARDAKKDMDISICGDQALTRRTAKFALFHQLTGISVPASDECMAQASVESGRAAILESLEQSALRDQQRATRRKADQESAAGKLPEGIINACPHVLEVSNLAFVVIEDEKRILKRYNTAIQKKGQPVLLCSNISDALDTIAAMQAKGKEVHIFSDAQIPANNYERRDTTNPLIDKIMEMPGKANGVKLAYFIADGKVPGISIKQISLLSFGNSETLPEGVVCHSKDGDVEEGLVYDIQKIINDHSFADVAKKRGSLVLLDDEPGFLADAKEALGKHMGLKVETFTKPNAALERIRGGGVQAVLTDQMMPEITGEEFCRNVRQITARMPVGIITSSDDFLCKALAKPYDPDAPALIHKDSMSDPLNSSNLKEFLMDAYRIGQGRSPGDN